MNLARSLGSVGGLTLVSRVLALVRDTLQASYVGASFASDAFFVAFRLPNMFRALFAEGAFTAAFIPMFNRKVGETGDVNAGIRFAEQALSVLLPVLVLFTVLMLLAAWPITWGLSGGFHDPSARQFAFAVLLSRITIPYLMLISLASLLGGILNSLEKFWVNAAAPILLNISMITALWFFHGTNAYETARAQAISVTVGGLLQLGWLMFASVRAGVKLSIRRPRIDDDIRRLLKLILPAAIGAGAVQVNLAVSTALAGGLLDPGSISYIYYADRLNQLPLGLIGIGLGTILLPTISRQLSQGRGAEAMQTQNRGIELALFLTLPATMAFIFASEPIIRGLFQHGRFTDIDSIRCSWALSAFSLGLPSYVLVKVLTPGYYARHDTRTPVRFAIQSVGINLVGNIIFIPLFSRYGFGHVGPPLATAIASTVNVWLLFRTLRQRGQFEADQRLRRKAPRIALSAIVMGASLYWIVPAVDPYLTGSILSRAAGLLSLVGCGAAIYALACLLTGAFVFDDLKMLKRQARKP